MKTVSGRSGLFYKFLLSYIILMIIPILIFIMLIFNSFLKLLTDDVLRKNRDMLIQVRDTIDSQMSELWKISVNLGKNPDLPKPENTMDPVRGMRLVQYVTNYSFSNNFADEMLLYFHGGMYIYSPSGTYTVENFINSIYHFEGWDESEFLDQINSISYPVVNPATDVTMLFSKKQRYILYMLPVPPSPANQYATVLFLINEKTVQNMMKNIVHSSSGNVVILDSKKNIISCLENSEYFNSDEFSKSLNRNEDSYTDIVRLNDTDYYFSSVISGNTKWQYVTIIPVREVVEKPARLKTQAMMGILLILLTGSIIISGMMYMNYTPIKKLKYFTEETLGRRLAASNELESVRQAIEDMSSTTKVLNTKIENSRSALKKDLILNLLNGRYATIEEFNEKGRDIGVVFTRKFLFTGILIIKNPDSHDKLMIIKDIEAYFLPYIECYGRESIDGNSLIFVFSTDEIGYQQLEEKFILLQTHLVKCWNIEVTIGIGNMYRFSGEVGKSFMEASTAIDYRLIKGNNKVILFSEIFKHQENIEYFSNEKLEQLELCMLQGNIKRVEEILNGIASYIDKNSVSLFMVRSICFDIINTVIKAVNRIKREYSNDISYPDVIKLTRFDTVEELIDTVQRICQDICRRIMGRKNQKKNQIEQLTTYISINYDSYDFSIQKMADHFQVSISNLSHYFKDQLGENISDYVNNLRMKKAKKLLEDNEYGLQEIVEKIGYTNVSSFIRKFRQATGMTPGEYRELLKTNG